MIYLLNQLSRVRRRWYVVVLVTVVIVAGAVIAGLGERTTYSAKAALSASSPTSENTPYALSLAYIYLFNDRAFQAALLRKAKVPNDVSATAEPATVGSIFYIDVTAATGQDARSAATAVANTFRAEINGALDDAKRQTIDSVQAPFTERYAQRLEVPGEERVNLQEQINTINANTNGMINSVGLESAVTETSPQNAATIAVALVGGLLVGVLAALGVDIVSRRVRTGYDVTDKTAYTTAVSITEHETDEGQTARGDIRRLANRLMSGSADRPHVIAVVAAAPGAVDCVRTLGVELACALGTSDSPVLLVRTDTRRGEHTDNAARPGFIDMLTESDLAIDDVADAHDDRVRVIGAGNRALDPAAVVSRARVADFLAAAREHADVVIVESPILAESPEGQIVCAQADVVLTVVDTRTAVVSELAETYRLLDEVKATIGPAVVMAARPVRAVVTPAVAGPAWHGTGEPSTDVESLADVEPPVDVAATDGEDTTDTVMPQQDSAEAAPSEPTPSEPAPAEPDSRPVAHLDGPAQETEGKSEDLGDDVELTIDERDEPQPEPESAELEVAELEQAEPVLGEPDEPEPATSEPALVEPELAEPELAEPELAEPDRAAPDQPEWNQALPEWVAVEPNDSELEPIESEPEPTEPEPVRTDATEPESTEPESSESELTDPDVVGIDSVGPEPAEPDPVEPQVVELDGSGVGLTRVPESPGLSEPEGAADESSEPTLATEPVVAADAFAEPVASEINPVLDRRPSVVGAEPGEVAERRLREQFDRELAARAQWARDQREAQTRAQDAQRHQMWIAQRRAQEEFAREQQARERWAQEMWAHQQWDSYMRARDQWVQEEWARYRQVQQQHRQRWEAATGADPIALPGPSSSNGEGVVDGSPDRPPQSGASPRDEPADAR